MLKGLHMGLTPEQDVLARAFARHLTWIDDFASMMSFVSGPVHVAYPPYLTIAGIRTPPLPSPGLFPAICDALREHGISLPEPEHFHVSSHGAWEMEIARWPNCKEQVREDTKEAIRRSLRRGVYHTHLPLVNLARFTEWLKSPFVEEYDHLGNLEKDGRGVDVFCIPSYLVTNNEVFALRKLLARDFVDANLYHYESYLGELLQNALGRRQALDQIRVPSELLTVAETFDGILRIRKEYWRICGRTHADISGQQAWEEFRERAEIPGGIIHVAARDGPP